MKKLLALLLAVGMVLCACQSAPEPSPSPSDPAGADDTGQPTATPGATEAPPYWQDLSNYTVVNMLGVLPTTTRKSGDDLLTPIWRDKTGIAMQVEDLYVQLDITQYLADSLRDGTLPEVLAVEELFSGYERMSLLKPYLATISRELAYECMPYTVERLARMGIDFFDWYDANADPQTGLWYTVPQLPSALFDESLEGTRYAADQIDLPLEYLWVRDDLANAINASVATVDELNDAVVGLGESLRLDTLFTSDAWLFSLDTLGEYAEKIKRDFFGVSPIHPTSGVDAGSLVYSFFSASGLWWTGEFPEFIQNIDSGGDYFAHYTSTEEWKEYLKWLNHGLHAGWFGTDYMTMTRTQRAEKVRVGEYAAVNWWMGEPQESASLHVMKDGAQASVKWRLWPVMTADLKTDKQDLSVYTVSLTTTGAVGFLKDQVDEELLKQLLAWVDWNYSLEAQDLRTWGKDMTQGEGGERRFTQEYTSVYESMLGLDLTGSNDAWYYGLVNTREESYEYWNHETYGVGGSDIGPNAPFYTYPLVQYSNVTGRELLPSQEYLVPSLLKRYLLEEGQLVIERAKSTPRTSDELQQLYASYKSNYVLQIASGMQEALLEVITGPEAEFEQNYARYANLYKQSDAAALEPLIKEYLKQQYAN